MISKYKETLEEDEGMLRSNSIVLTSNMVTAVRLRASEKKMLRATIKSAQTQLTKATTEMGALVAAGKYKRKTEL